MIESTAGYAGTYYYHFDALGSVVALTNSSGNTVEVYEYDVFGRVGATDASHPNRFMFTGREFDRETGLYYYRARYYNPQIGRFLQTDPIGYGDGMNWYAYCGNNAVNCNDPLGESGNWEDLSFGPAGYRVKDGDNRTYYMQPAKMACGPTAVVNLYVACDRINTLANCVWNTFPSVRTGFNNLYGMIPQWAMLMFERQHNGNMSLQPQLAWDNKGINDFGTMASVINMGFSMNYGTVKIRTDGAGVDTVTEYIKRAPILMKVRTDRVECPEDGVSWHAIVVTWCATAQSHRPAEDGNLQWVSTPYEVIDSWQGKESKVYLTEDEFAKLLKLSPGEIVVNNAN
jgi:RHS repeat-associated protein